MKSWLVLAVGLALAALAGLSLLTLRTDRSTQPSASSVVVRKQPASPAAPPPDDHIDEASRDALREILRDAESGEAR